MELKKIEKKDDWNAFVMENGGQFLQSFEWGNLYSPDRILRLRVEKGGNKILQALITKEKSVTFGNFYIPYGPIFNKEASLEEKKESFNFLLKKIKEMAAQEKIVFLRIESYDAVLEIKNLQYVISSRRIQPKETMILDIDRSENEIIMGFQKNNRYNIRLAEKKGVEIKMSDDYSSVFYKLIGETKERQGFISHIEEHYKKLFNIADDYFKVKLFLAEYEKKIILAKITISFGGRMTSLHPGSEYKFRATKAHNFAHWKALLFGRKVGCKIYDFWGLDEKKYPGVTGFKKSFGGQRITYPEGIDIIFKNNSYKAYILLRKLKYIFKNG